MREFKPELLYPPRTNFSFLTKNQIINWKETLQLVDLEIGAGVGWHAINYSLTHPERKLIALERTTEKFLKFERRLKNHQSIQNLYAIHADAIPWSVHFLPEACIDRIFILYPNPYPKNKSARFFNMSFFIYLLTKLKQNGTIHLATNEYDYQMEAQEVAQKKLGLRLIQYNELSERHIPKARTHFEKKYLLRNQVCYDLIFQKS